ncbi:stage III sporulation protein AA [Alkalihalophilus marmarensis]|uniref:stage III sporulation protein AA n=1 Tax=Alkalihalophilus marmarensis TaxID=521377 RepID=UPI002E21D281|nr:stage III sporulation protein AA [Alkalihalophilus marmarensis]MED1601117.1 stage III sporulation protein AA [Alkalihalophilus marmarensis]
MLDDILAVVPESIRVVLRQIPAAIINDVEEIRIRIARPLEVVARGKPFYPTNDDGSMYIVQPKEGQLLLSQLSQHSLYAFEEELKKGFITIHGGHRVGLAGKVILEKGEVKTIRDVSSFNIRIARQSIGMADRLIHYLFENRWLNTLFIGPPQTGKTTILRDVARLISEGDEKRGIAPLKVGIIDERSEICASMRGVPQHQLGPRIDVLDGCPKAEGMMMMIRSMSPDVLIVDEIGRVEDVLAVQEAVHAGVGVITTAHGHTIDDVLKRPALKELMQFGAFDLAIELTRTTRPGVVKKIHTFNKREKLSSSRAAVVREQ